MFSNEHLKKILLKAELMTEEEFNKRSEEAEKAGKNLDNYLLEKKVISSMVLFENAAAFFKIPFIDLKNQTIRKDILFTIPEPIASMHNIIAFDASDKDIKIACLDPKDLEIFEFIKKKTNLNRSCI